MPTERKTWIEILKQLLLMNMAATVVASIFNVANYGIRTVSVTEFTTTFAYSNCIGSLVSLVIYGLAPRWNKNPAIIRFLKALVSFFIATFLGVISARYILSFFFREFASQTLMPGWRNFIFSVGMGLTFGFAFYYYDIVQTKLRRKEIDEEKARALATEAQLASLESKIHPHFLFNTLNSIASLIRDEPVLAEKMVEKLSALLRYSLDSSANNTVTFEQELDITVKYLEIEKIRFQDRLEYAVAVDDKLANVKVPPLALQTLVENSIKHVASKTSQRTKISVSAKTSDTSSVIEVSDNGPGFDSESIRDGHGLHLLAERLNVIYKGEAKLDVVENGTVRLTIPR